MRREHAQHNLDLCERLIEIDEGYNDWIVTTSFYSAIHFIEYALFPLEEFKSNYDNFNIYYQSNKYKNKNNIHYSKHECKLDLVRKYLPGVATAYRELLEDCMNARYKNYQVSTKTAKAAYEHAKKIKIHCLSFRP